MGAPQGGVFRTVMQFVNGYVDLKSYHHPKRVMVDAVNFLCQYLACNVAD